MGKEATGVLAHGAHQLTKVKKKAAMNVLHHDVHEVADNAGARLNHCASVAEFKHLDDALMLKVLEDLNFVVNGDDWFLVAAQEFFFHNFDGDFGAVYTIISEVNFGGVTFATRL